MNITPSDDVPSPEECTKLEAYGKYIKEWEEKGFDEAR